MTLSPNLMPADSAAVHSRTQGVKGWFAPLALAVVLVGCSLGDSEAEAPAEPAAKRLAGRGISLELPRGWYGRVGARGFPLPGAAIAHVASLPLPPRDDDWGSRARQRIGEDDVLLVLSEGLSDASFAEQRPRLGRDVRLAAVEQRFLAEHWFAVSGRAFVLQSVFGSERPPERLVRRVNAVLASLVIEPRTRALQPAPDPAPPRALAPPRLHPTPMRVLNQCRLAQDGSRFPILCPARLLRAFVAWPRSEPPPLAAERLPAPGVSWRSHSDPRYRLRTFSGVTIGYGAPWEPDSGPDWRLHLWRNRPCCFLHFEVFWRAEGRRHVPAGGRPATLGGRRGLLKDATSYGLASPDNDHLYWANHTRFLWREDGVPYVATLHRFGTLQETRELLGRLVRELRPARELGGR